MWGDCVKCRHSGPAGKCYYGYCAACWVKLDEERRRILIEHNPIVVNRTTPGWPTWVLLACILAGALFLPLIQWLIHQLP